MSGKPHYTEIERIDAIGTTRNDGKFTIIGRQAGKFIMQCANNHEFIVKAGDVFNADHVFRCKDCGFDKVCQRCNEPFHTFNNKQKYCGDKCRDQYGVRADSGEQRQTKVTKDHPISAMLQGLSDEMREVVLKDIKDRATISADHGVPMGMAELERAFLEAIEIAKLEARQPESTQNVWHEAYHGVRNYGRWHYLTPINP